MTKEIPLTRGQATLVDDDDYERLSQLKWFAKRSKCGAFYAARNTRKGQALQKMQNVIIPPPPGLLVDHINGNSLDNRKSNLRIATFAQNQQNRAKSSANTSGYKGVSWHKQRSKWVAEIKAKGKHTSLGLFTDIKEAARAYDAAAIENYGEFARLNFPQGQPIGGPTY